MTKDKDDLAVAVETAIEYQIQNHGFGPHVSRAAIIAMLEWYSKEENISFDMVQSVVDAQFDEISHDLTANARRRHYMAAAMAAELKRRQG